MAGNFFKKKLEYILSKERQPKKLALSCALGAFIAFSPYLGIQTILALFLGWVFGLNVGIVVVVTYAFNNPWTMFPIAILDYVVGVWLTESLFHLNLAYYNPAWMNSFTAWLGEKLSYCSHYCLATTHLSFWAYIIGGHVVSLIAALIAYPIAKRFFTALNAKLSVTSPENTTIP